MKAQTFTPMALLAALALVGSLAPSATAQSTEDDSSFVRDAGPRTQSILQFQPEPEAAAEPQTIVPEAAVPGESQYDQYMRQGYALSRQGDYQAALQSFENALTVNPNDRLATIAYWNMVNALMASGQSGQGQMTTSQATATSAQANAAQGVRLNSAAIGATGASAATLTTFDDYMNAGYAATEARNYPTALQYFEQAQRIRPNNPYVQQALRNVATYLLAQ